jgi:MoxR-like ATPase
MATQNPIEQEGTYPLPEAQLDRFLMHVTIDYPDAEEELDILKLARTEAKQSSKPEVMTPITQQVIFAAREEVLSLFMAENVEQYLLQIVLATRNAGAYGDDLSNWLQYGASPRATITLDRCARAHAWLKQRDYVGPEDVQAVAHEVLRHRLILNYEAEAEGMTTDAVISELIARIAVP